MGLLDRLLGREPATTPTPQAAYQASTSARRADATPQDAPAGSTPDEVAIARYRYLLRTAPPEKIEEAHAEAFAQLTPEQRQQVLGRLSDELPEGERPGSDQPADLARAATRAELRQPGFMQRSFGGGMGMGAGMGAGGMIMTSMLGTIAGVVIGTAVADALFSGFDSSPEAADVGAGGADGSGDPGDPGAGDPGAGDAGYDSGGVDAGGDTYASDVGSDMSSDSGFGGFGDWGGGGDGGFDGGFGDF